MTKQIRLNAFDMNCVGHIQHGLWTHPRDRSTTYNTIEYWQNLARTAERGLFDGIFLADIVGVYDVYKGSPAPSLENAVQVPVNDPMLVVPVMAAVTKHIGFGVTANLTYEAPYLFARRMSTLDHLTGGRVGWNIVTGYLDSAARAMGFKAQREHDDRYDVADEFMEVVYKLWEGSWEGDAVVRDRERRLYARPGQGAPDPACRSITTTSMRSICPSRRRSGRRCSIRPAPRRAARTLPPTMPSASSSTDRTRNRPARRWRTCGSGPPSWDGIRMAYSSSSGAPS